MFLLAHVMWKTSLLEYSIQSAGLKKKKKEKPMTKFRLQTKKRIVVARIALSMGVNFGDIPYVINWGPARNLLDEL